jgi:hypothetical protein
MLGTVNEKCVGLITESVCFQVVLVSGFSPLTRHVPLYLLFLSFQIVNDKQKDAARRKPAQTYIGKETEKGSGNSTWVSSK